MLMDLFFDDYGFFLDRAATNMVFFAWFALWFVLAVVVLTFAKGCASRRCFVVLKVVCPLLFVGGALWLGAMSHMHGRPNPDESVTADVAGEIRSGEEFFRYREKGRVFFSVSDKIDPNLSIVASSPELATEAMRKKYKECYDVLREHIVGRPVGEPFVSAKMAACAAIQGWEKQKREPRSVNKNTGADSVQLLHQRDEQTEQRLLGSE